MQTFRRPIRPQKRSARRTTPAVLLCSVALVTSAHAQDTSPVSSSANAETSHDENGALSKAKPVTLWQGLEAGMSPEKALPIIQEMPGIKRARLYRRRSAENPDQIRIGYASGKIQIGDMEYILQPRFSQKRLKQVWLASGDQCSNDAISVFNRLSSGLAVKYPQVIFEKDMRESDISRANLNARRSGEKQTISQIYASDKVVVLLTFAFSNERPPPFPTARSRFALAAYEIVRSNFEARKQECSGTGNKRMDIALQYMTRRDFEAKASETSESIRARQDQLVDQL